MHFTDVLLVLGAAASTAQAFELPRGFDFRSPFGGNGGSSSSSASASATSTASSSGSTSSSSSGSTTSSDGTCPSIWTQIGKDLQGKFVDGGQCNDLARAAIRTAFHDPFAGGADGSLYLAKEYTRHENAGLAQWVPILGGMAESYKVGVADFLQFAGAAAILACPQGPKVQVLVGRTDSSTPSQEGQLPGGHDNATKIIPMFQAKGFSPEELVALIGAHTASRQFFDNPAKFSAPQDTTPGTWDVQYYGQTLGGQAPDSFHSDTSIAQNSQTSGTFKSFVGNQQGWALAFAPAMQKLSVLGAKWDGQQIDCTSALAAGTSLRDKRAAPLMGRA